MILLSFGAGRYFEFDRLATNWRTEILADLTTFITMAYILTALFLLRFIFLGKG